MTEPVAVFRPAAGTLAGWPVVATGGWRTPLGAGREIDPIEGCVRQNSVVTRADLVRVTKFTPQKVEAWHGDSGIGYSFRADGSCEVSHLQSPYQRAGPISTYQVYQHGELYALMQGDSVWTTFRIQKGRMCGISEDMPCLAVAPERCERFRTGIFRNRCESGFASRLVRKNGVQTQQLPNGHFIRERVEWLDSCAMRLVLLETNDPRIPRTATGSVTEISLVQVKDRQYRTIERRAGTVSSCIEWKLGEAPLMPTPLRGWGSPAIRSSQNGTPTSVPTRRRLTGC